MTLILPEKLPGTEYGVEWARSRGKSAVEPQPAFADASALLKTVRFCGHTEAVLVGRAAGVADAAWITLGGAA